MDKDRELQHIAGRLARLLAAGLGTRSIWALRTAVEAADTDGIAGVLVVEIPPKSKDFPEVSFTCGTVDVVKRWAS